MRIFFRLLLAVIFWAGVGHSSAALKLAGIFGDNVVIQRGDSIPVWGAAQAGEVVTLVLGDKKATATAGADGKWIATFQGLSATDKTTLTVTGKSETVTLQNVAIGDVWVCSGQSNMEYHLEDRDEIAAANRPGLRYFRIPHTTAREPLKELNGHWDVATPKTAINYSAVAYYFAKNVNIETGVPIGLICAYWSGSNLQPWSPLESLQDLPNFNGELKGGIDLYWHLDADAEKFWSDYQAWQQKNGRTDPGNKGLANGWATANFNDNDWTTTATPGDWTNLGLPNGGIVWIRKIFSLRADAAGKDLSFATAINDLDTVYCNGEEVGMGNTQKPYFWNETQKITIPGRLVKAGPNLIAIRILRQKPKGATLQAIQNMGLSWDDAVPLNNDWKVKAEAEFSPLSPDALAALPYPPFIHPEQVPTVMYNAMIAPIAPFRIKGVLWYQGEFNAWDAVHYRAYLTGLIKGWRAHWAEGDFPFYIVQLPNISPPPTGPGEGPTEWAALRESQLQTWQSVPNTGIAVTIDVGDANNIHPGDKKDVGYRLSRPALALTYGKQIEYSGPLYDSMAVEGNKIRLKFTHLGGGLVSKDGGPLKQFVIAGSDKKWAWGDAVIDGDTVVVSSPAVSIPVAVRYAWANNPAGCNLSNKAGLMATPFRTDPDAPVSK
jgi:sialate O-acetylesterase